MVKEKKMMIHCGRKMARKHKTVSYNNILSQVVVLKGRSTLY